MKEMICIRGVPKSLAQDAWWLDTADLYDGDREPPNGVGLDFGKPPENWGEKWVRLLVVGLVSIWVFWGHSVGLSLALFAHVLFALSCWHLEDRTAVRRAWGLLLVASLPVIDYVQLLSVVSLGFGLIASLLWARQAGPSTSELFFGVLGGVARLPKQWRSQLPLPFATSALKTSSTRQNTPFGTARFNRILSDWGFPAGGVLVISALLLRANPFLSDIVGTVFDLAELLPRLMFGAGIAFLSAPLLVRDMPMQGVVLPAQNWTVPGFGINRRSVLRALVMFNLLIAAQTLTDISIILLGATLPHGMTLAEYAHHGAYPLLASALLAGGFALAAHPYLRDHRLIRPLMILYIAQNAVLCLAALMRLDLYVQEFGLTYLRAYSLIWMGLVALGLCVMLWQIGALKSRIWLAARVVVLAGVTLYASSLVNFAGVIASHNLTRGTQDYGYICGLGPNAFHAALVSGQGEIVRSAYDQRPVGVQFDDCRISRDRISSWQEWGFRKWRVAHILPSDYK